MPAEQGPRRVVLQMGVSLDAIAAIPRGNGTMPVMEGQWGLPPEPPELTELKLAWLREADAHLMGRVTYEAMAGYWPMSTHPYAALMNDIPKVVFSKTLDRADWPDSQIARGDIADEVARLKREPGKDLIAHGGASFAQSLARHNLIDEYRLMIHPVAIGSGLPVFKDLTTPLRLELIDARTFGGTSVRVYARA
ncbi:MAG TPA: dihydrofolate reductase family protein [Solirubrobacteraceae bacterium]|nr:dihydrofolate reductase family protein [Solirubrobacteraceae bacterium]